MFLPPYELGTLCSAVSMLYGDGRLGRMVGFRSPETSFCGYTQPHPSESRVVLRLQTTGRPATDVLREGLDDLSAASRFMHSKFDEAIEEHKAGSA